MPSLPQRVCGLKTATGIEAKYTLPILYLSFHSHPSCAPYIQPCITGQKEKLFFNCQRAKNFAQLRLLFIHLLHIDDTHSIEQDEEVTESCIVESGNVCYLPGYAAH